MGGVFICWSGDRSKAIALALQKLLRAVLSPQPDVFISQDIDKGADWFRRPCPPGFVESGHRRGTRSVC